MPSEEEWEWAARGGSEGRAYPWGDEAPGSQVCWSGVAQRNGTCPVGTYPAGDAPGGVHDLMGNVWEWTDSSFSLFLPTSEPHGAAQRIARGGGWSTKIPSHLANKVRNWRPPVERVNSLGFRCVMVPDKDAAASAFAGVSRAEIDRLHALRQGRDPIGSQVPARPAPWTPSDPAKWRSAIESYVPAVRRGNQTPLNGARTPFATYLNAMHGRIHPLFSESFLPTLGSSPPRNPASGLPVFTRLEIVLTPDGHIKQMGVIKKSDLPDFDGAVLDAVERAAPFGPAPSAILSQDGHVYLHWEFHSDPVVGCSTINASPFLLVQPAVPGPAAAPLPSTGSAPSR